MHPEYEVSAGAPDRGRNRRPEPGARPHQRHPGVSGPRRRV